MWLLNAAIFFVLFAFALNNQDDITLHLFFGARWEAPLVLVLLLALIVGVFLGVAVMLPLWLRARKARKVALAGKQSSDLTLTQFPDQNDSRHGS